MGNGYKMRDTLRLWNQDVTLENEQACWDFGSLFLCLHSKTNEWQIRYEHKPCAIEDEPNEVKCLPLTNKAVDLSSMKLKRYISNEENKLYFAPCLPDRSIVVKTIDTIYLLPGKQITLFVSVSLWVRLMARPSEQMLCEIPIRELSDTWFGANPLMGEMCYSSKTRARTDKTALITSANRAIIPVTIYNKNSETLELSKFSIPSLTLSLYENNVGGLWSSRVEFTHLKDAQGVQLSTEKLNEDITGFKEWQKISEPRQPIKGSFINKAISTFFTVS